MSLTSQATQNLIARLETSAKESIEDIERGNLPRTAKQRHKADILTELIKDRAELELQAIRTDLALAKNPEAIKAEMYWADEDIKSDRCPGFLREIFQHHVFECSSLLEKVQGGFIALIDIHAPEAP